MELHPFDPAVGEAIHCYEPQALTHYKVGNPNEKGPCPTWPPAGWTNGVEWLEKNVVDIWRPAIDDGTFIFAGELGCHQGNVPHATYLAWLEDTLMMCKRHGWGWRSGISTAHSGYSTRLAPTASSRTSTGTSSTARRLTSCAVTADYLKANSAGTP